MAKHLIWRESQYKMPKAMSIRTKKILRMTLKRKEKIFEEYREWGEAKLARYFIDYGISEQTLVMEALNSFPREYREKTAYYINHPTELEEALAKSSKLEQKAK